MFAGVNDKSSHRVVGQLRNSGLLGVANLTGVANHFAPFPSMVLSPPGFALKFTAAARTSACITLHASTIPNECEVAAFLTSLSFITFYSGLSDLSKLLVNFVHNGLTYMDARRTFVICGC